MAAVSLGVRYLQVSQQLQHLNSVLEATNSSLRQQLRLKITQLGQREQDLQGSRKELAQSREALEVEHRDCQAVKEQLQACQSDSKATKETLQREEEQRRTLEERLNRIRDTLKPFYTMGPEDTCCPVGWILMEKKCFYISPVKRSWEESRNYCITLSSSLAIVSDSDYLYSGHRNSILHKLLAQVSRSDSYWIDGRPKDGHWINGKGSGYHSQNQHCRRIPYSWSVSQDCTNSLPCICEREALKCPDQHWAEDSRQQEPVPPYP